MFQRLPTMIVALLSHDSVARFGFRRRIVQLNLIAVPKQNALPRLYELNPKKKKVLHKMYLQFMTSVRFGSKTTFEIKRA